MAESFKALGFPVEIIDLAKEKKYENIQNLLESPSVNFVLGMNGHPIQHISSHIYGDKETAPFIAFLVDHPMYHLHRFNFDLSSKNLIVSCFDNTHIHYLNRYFKGSFTRIFIPHGSSVDNSLAIQPIKNRSIDILFAGSYIDTKATRSTWLVNKKYGRLLDEIMERTLYQTQQPLIDIAQQVFRAKGVPFDYTTNKTLQSLLIKVDYYIRGRRREEVLRSLNNLSMQIYNNKWSFLSSKSSKVRVYPSIDYLDFKKKMTEAKIVLNISPTISYGSHDRIFTSMLAGAVCLTEINPYLSKIFTDKKDILFYNLKNLTFQERVQALLNHNQLQDIATQGRNIALSSHTWLERARQIIRIVTIHQKRKKGKI
jgi:spore maturation protein CgeB